MKATQMKTNGGNPAPHQFILEDKAGTLYFQSYDTIIARLQLTGTAPSPQGGSINGTTYLDEHYWDYSATTGKYRNQFLGEGIAETRAKIESGEYILMDLNS